MAQFAMPIVVLNMGGEMMYILEQRLTAQSIPDEKSKKVLADVGRAMFNEKFIDELFKPQEISSAANIRAIFDKLAHSSIMRLNENSMDKLYDLMTMGFKYQIIGCASPVQLLQVTLNHLDTVRKSIDNPAVLECIERTYKAVVNTYSVLTVGDYFNLKQALLRFLQDRRVKVSLFLQDGLQNLDGTMVLFRGGCVAPGGEVPGSVKYFGPGGFVTETVAVTAVAVPGALPPSEGSALSSSSRPVALGENMYNRPRKTAAEAAKPKPGPNGKHGSGASGSSSATAAASSASDHAPVPPASVPPASSDSKLAEEPVPAAAVGAGVPVPLPEGSGKAGLNLLAALIGPGGATAPSATESFKITSLFPDTGASAGTGSGGVKGDLAQVITLDAADNKTFHDMLSKLMIDDGGGKEAEGDDDDLLSLMDKAK